MKTKSNIEMQGAMPVGAGDLLGRIYRLIAKILDRLWLYELRTDFQVWAYHQGCGKYVGMEDEYILWLENRAEWRKQWSPSQLKALDDPKLSHSREDDSRNDGGVQ